MIMERPIGDKFLTPDGMELEVVLAERLCRGCYYREKHECLLKEVDDNIGVCTSEERTNGKQIIFKQAK